MAAGMGMPSTGASTMATARSTGSRRLAGCLVLAAGLAAASTPALAQHRHHHHGHGPRVHFGFVFGAPVYPRWHHAPRYYYPAPVIVQSQPPVYIEQEPQQAATVPPETAYSTDAAAYWYFCRESNTYYPYVKSCAGPWQRVTPQPPPG